MPEDFPMKETNMRSFFASAALLATVASTATAQVTPSSSLGPDGGALPGQTTVLNFNNCASPSIVGITITGGACQTTSVSGQYAQPWQSSSGGGYYTTMGPYTSPSTIVIDFSTWLSNNAFNKVLSVSLYWGSIDTYQNLQVLDGSDNVLATIMGGSIPPANGNQVNPSSNRRANLAFAGTTQDDFRKLKFVSTQAAFEFDDVAIEGVSRGTVVPEPATVTLLASALGMLGLFGARRKRNSTQA